MEYGSTLLTQVLSIGSGTRCSLIEDSLVLFTFRVGDLCKRESELLHWLELASLDNACLQRGAHHPTLEDIGW